MSECPKCDSEIGNAWQCGCGWKRPAKMPVQYSQDQPRCVCEHPNCNITAFVKVDNNNLCELHYTAYFKRRSEITCERLGLDTVEKKRAYVRKILLEMGKRRVRYEEEAA